MTSSVPESFTKRILKGKKFRGTYQEKRFCKDVQKYKDIIVVKSSDEANVALDFNLFLDLFATSPKWVGLTRNEEEYCIWTELEDENLPFDDYDFEIKTVRSTDTEVQLKLRFQDANKSNSKSMSIDGQGFDLSTIKWADYEPKKILSAVLGYLMSIQWNWAAIKQSVEFVLVTIVFLVSELPNMIRFVGEFTLRAFRELSNLIHVLTPILMAIIDMCSKIFGVSFMLISDVIRSGRNRGGGGPAIAAGQHHRQQQIEFR